MSQSKYFVAAISVDGVFSWALRRLCDDGTFSRSKPIGCSLGVDGFQVLNYLALFNTCSIMVKVEKPSLIDTPASFGRHID